MSATWWGRHRTAVAIGLGVLAALVVAILLSSGPRTSTPLDPDNPGPAGARALARVLADQGVEVTVVRSADALERTGVDAGTTVVVTGTDALGASTIARLRAHTDGARLVLVAPGQASVDALDVTLGSPVDGDGARPADCVGRDLADTLDGLSIDVRTGMEYPTPAGCFFGSGGAVVAQPADDLILLGSGEIITNERIVVSDHAAVALRLLGGHQRLVWYVPDAADLAGADAVAISDLLPPWLRPGLWLVGLAVVAVMWWQGRRLGPLATEPLPVVVKAVESTQSRGRLYRKVGDRGHAAAALRSAARADLAARLRLSGATDTLTLVHAVARQTGRPVAEIGPLLDPDAPPPPTDDDLIRLAGDLAGLDREARRA